jgi:hypothetical protein
MEAAEEGEGYPSVGGWLLQRQQIATCKPARANGKPVHGSRHPKLQAIEGKGTVEW